MITFELFEMARRIAGVTEVQVEASTLRAALAALAAVHPGLMPDVIDKDVLASHWRAGLGARAWIEDPDQALADGDRIVLVSALAGG